MYRRPSEEITALARRLRADATRFERRLWAELRFMNKQGTNLRRQVPFRRYILDFADHGHRVVVELDGIQHGEEAQRTRDETRDAMLAGEGYEVLRFVNVELIENMEGVVDRIWRTAMRGRK